MGGCGVGRVAKPPVLFRKAAGQALLTMVEGPLQHGVDVFPVLFIVEVAQLLRLDLFQLDGRALPGFNPSADQIFFGVVHVRMFLVFRNKYSTAILDGTRKKRQFAQMLDRCAIIRPNFQAPGPEPDFPCV